MDKARFIEVSPLYYALAICVVIRENGGVLSRGDIEDYFRYEDVFGTPLTRLAKAPVFEAAVDWLTKLKMLETLLDDFGPPIYRRGLAFDEEWHSLAEQSNLPFHKYNAIASPHPWLTDALNALNNTYDRLGISAEDFYQSEKVGAEFDVDEAEISPETLHQMMLDKIQDVESSLSELAAQQAGIGHNNPPEAIDSFPITQKDREQITQALATLRRTPAILPAQNLPEVQEAAEQVQSLSIRMKDYLARHGDGFVTNAVKAAGTAAGTAVVGGLTVLLMERLGALHHAVINWLSVIHNIF